MQKELIKGLLILHLVDNHLDIINHLYFLRQFSGFSNFPRQITFFSFFANLSANENLPLEYLL